MICVDLSVNLSEPHRAGFIDLSDLGRSKEADPFHEEDPVHVDPAGSHAIDLVKKPLRRREVEVVRERESTQR